VGQGHDDEFAGESDRIDTVQARSPNRTAISCIAPARPRCAGILVGSGGTSAPWHRPYLLGQAPSVAEGAPQQHLDLGVGTAQLVVGPACECVVNRRVDPEKDRATVAHV
jgi:hypothetical protein